MSETPAGEPPTVSVVVPTHDRPEFLPGAIETAVGQDHGSVEVVVVDDGSPTDYAEEAVARAPETVSLVAHEESRGPAAARNAGVGATAGEYVAFLDDDDRWHRSKLRRQVRALEAAPKAGLATCSAVLGRTDGTVVRCEELGRPEGDLAAEACIDNPVGEPSRVVLRRAVIQDLGGFETGFPTTEDREFFLRVCQDWPVVAVDHHLLYRTLHDGNHSDDVATKEQARLAVYRTHEATVRSHHDWDAVLGFHHAWAGRRYLDVPNFPVARHHLRRSLAHGVSARRLALFLLAFTTPAVAERAVGLKRAVDPTARAPEPSLAVSPATVPGLGRGGVAVEPDGGGGGAATRGG